MEYPGASLTKPIRRAILFTFMAAFFIITPLILMYSTGYRYDWQTGIIRETGSLSIDVTPTTAYVYLDGLPLDSSLPVELKNITPKKYHVTITAPGYHSWEKEITVDRKQTTYIKDIQLIKYSSSTKLLSGTTSDISISPSGRELLVVRQAAAKSELVAYNPRTNQATTLLSFPNDTPVSFAWSERHAYVAITVATKPNATILVVNSERPTEITNLTATGKKTISRVVWRDTSEPTLYYGTSSSLAIFYPRLREDRVFTPNTYRDWYIANDTLWTLAATGTQLTITSDQLGFRETFATVSSSDPGFDPVEFHFQSVSRDYALLNNHAGTMAIFHSSNHFMVQADKALVSPFNNWLLLWNNAELWSYVAGESPYLLHRTGSTLKKVVPLDSHNTLALQFENEVLVLYPYQYIQTSLLTESVKDIAAHTETRTLYYSTDQGLYSLAY